MLCAPGKVVWWQEIREGNALVGKVEAYRRGHHRLPASLEEAGISEPDSSRLFYEKCNDGRYVVWFGTSLGKSMSYSSETGNWVPLNIGCREQARITERPKTYWPPMNTDKHR